MMLFWAPQTRAIRAIFLRQFNRLPETQNIETYADRCMARDAYQRALAAAGE